MKVPGFTAEASLDRTNRDQYRNTYDFSTDRDQIVPQFFACIGEAIQEFGQCAGHGYNEACRILLHLRVRSCFL